jgi:hypothetical protein
VRTLLKVFAVIAAVLLAPVLAWWVWNSIDEAPSAKAREYMEPLARGLPDGRNAWLFMVGLDAADGEDPMVLGRRRVDAYEARLVRNPVPKATAAETAFFDPVVDITGLAKGQALCDGREADCVAWAGENRELLARLERDNALLLRRYAALLGMRELQEVATPSNIDPSLLPTMPIRVDALYANLTARDVAVGRDPAAAAARLAQATHFWRFAETQAATLLLKLTAIRAIERHQRVLGAIVDRATTAQLAALQPHADVVLAEPSPAQRDFRPMMRYEYQATLDTIRREMASTPVMVTRCFDKEHENCLKKLVMGQGYAPQATANRLAELYADSELFHNVSARDYRSVEASVGAAISRKAPLDGDEGPLGMFGYNPVGKILAFIAIPAYSWVPRNHDCEALRRMLVLKLQARRQRIGADRMDAFLAAQPEALRNPYTGEPFAWDATRQEIGFAPVAVKYWKVERLGVPYR